MLFRKLNIKTVCKSFKENKITIFTEDYSKDKLILMKNFEYTKLNATSLQFKMIKRIYINYK